MTGVWVAEQGEFSERNIVGVYATAEGAMAAHPIPDKPSRLLREPGWRQIGPGAWENCCGYSDAVGITLWEVGP